MDLSSFGETCPCDVLSHQTDDRHNEKTLLQASTNTKIQSHSACHRTTQVDDSNRLFALAEPLMCSFSSLCTTEPKRNVGKHTSKVKALQVPTSWVSDQCFCLHRSGLDPLGLDLGLVLLDASKSPIYIIWGHY
eukprot:6153036-Amphidinium_carterae.2